MFGRGPFFQLCVVWGAGDHRKTKGKNDKLTEFDQKTRVVVSGDQMSGLLV